MDGLTTAPAIVLVLGGLCVAAGALLGGLSGFGYGLVATPLLLVLGLPLPLVVATNMLLGGSTRAMTAWTFRGFVAPRRVAALIAGTVPGVLVGLLVLEAVDRDRLRQAVGAVVIAGAVAMMAARGRATSAEWGRGPASFVGFLGGGLGVTTSLNGVPPVLMYTWEGAPPRRMVADLSVFFVASNAIVALLLLGTRSAPAGPVLGLFLLWLPGVLLATYLSNRLVDRIPEAQFRRLVLGIVMLGGLTALLS